MSAELNGHITPEEQLTGALDTSAQLVGSLNIGSGGGGTDNYNDLSNKPQINNVTLSGNKTTADLGLFSGYIEDLHYTDLHESGTVPYMVYSGQSQHWGINTGAQLHRLSDVAFYSPSSVANGDILAIDGAGTPNYKWTKTHLGAAAYTNDYNDLTNKPTIPAAQVNSDWNSSSGVSEILNKPTLAAVATSGDYDDLTNKPTIPAAQVNSDWNSSSGVSEILNKPTLATVATTGAYNDLSGKPTFTVITRSKTMSLAAGASGYFQLDEVLDFPASNSYLIGFFGYAALTYATRGTIMSAGLIENGAKPYIHYQVGEAGFTDVPFYFRFVFYTP